MFFVSEDYNENEHIDNITFNRVAREDREATEEGTYFYNRSRHAPKIEESKKFGSVEKRGE